MKFYSQVILPRFLNLSMSDKSLEVKRAELLAQARGDVLEIGSGSGLNFKHYPAAVRKVTGLDVNPGMQKLAQANVAAAPCPVELVTQDGERLPFEEATFDTVVSTWTLCSIEKVETALREIHRVLKPEGVFLFIEHGLAPDRKVQFWQKRLTPLQKRIAGNCHLDRPIRRLIEGQAFQIKELKEYYLENTPKAEGYFYQGAATRA